MRALLIVCSIAFAGWTVPARSADYVAMSGKDLYMRFCASCHGETGRGDGPVASSLRVEVPDLTLMARRAGGVYSRDRIDKVIDGRHVIAAHGSRTMPIWGEDLGRLELGSPDAERSTRLIIQRLADYVWLLQKPDPQDASPQETSPQDHGSRR